MATWIGVIVGITGIVLAIVTIRLAEATDRRAQTVNDQVIKSLQKIETEVERTSSDTKNLIQVAWEHMVSQTGSADASVGASNAAGVRQIAAGIAAELRGEQQDEKSASGDEHRSDPDAMFEQLTERLDRTLESLSSTGTTRTQLDAAITKLNALSAPATELVGLLLRGGHITPQQVRKSAGTTLRRALSELRSVDIVVPLTGHGDPDNLVYWFPPGMAETFDRAMTLARNRSPRARAKLSEELKSVGYSAIPESEGEDDPADDSSATERDR